MEPQRTYFRIQEVVEIVSSDTVAGDWQRDAPGRKSDGKREERVIMESEGDASVEAPRVVRAYGLQLT